MPPATPISASSDRRPTFGAVLAHIDAHPDDDLRLQRLSKLAGVSRFHFHHLFSAHFGVGVHRYVTLVRLRRAAYQLAFRQRLRVVDVAFAAGYESPEAFARAFKKAVGQTPSAFRARPDWSRWNAMNHHLTELRGRAATQASEAEVTIAELAPIRVAALELRTRPLRVGEALRSLIAWRIENRLPPGRSATYNVFHNPSGSSELDLCVATDRRILPNSLGVREKWIPGGRYAIRRHVGTNETLFEAAYALHKRWLPASGEQLGDGPLVIRRLSFFPDVAEHEAASEIFLPLIRSGP